MERRNGIVLCIIFVLLVAAVIAFGLEAQSGRGQILDRLDSTTTRMGKVESAVASEGQGLRTHVTSETNRIVSATDARLGKVEETFKAAGAGVRKALEGVADQITAVDSRVWKEHSVLEERLRALLEKAEELADQVTGIDTRVWKEHGVLEKHLVTIRSEAIGARLEMLGIRDAVRALPAAATPEQVAKLQAQLSSLGEKLEALETKVVELKKAPPTPAALVPAPTPPFSVSITDTRFLGPVNGLQRVEIVYQVTGGVEPFQVRASCRAGAWSAWEPQKGIATCQALSGSAQQFAVQVKESTSGKRVQDIVSRQVP